MAGWQAIPGDTYPPPRFFCGFWGGVSYPSGFLNRCRGSRLAAGPQNAWSQYRQRIHYPLAVMGAERQGEGGRADRSAGQTDNQH